MNDSQNLHIAQRIYEEGLVLLGEGKTKYAEQKFLDSLQYGSLTCACRRLIEIYQDQNEEQEADRFIEKAYHINPNQDKCSLEFVNLLLKRGEIEKAKRIAKNTILRNPDYKPAIRFLDEIEKRSSD